MIQNFYLQNFTNQIVPEVEEIRYSNLFKFQHDKMQMLSDFQLNEVRTKFCLWFESNYWWCQVLTNWKPVKSDPLPKIYSLVRVARVKSINFNNNFQNLIEALDMIYDPNELKVIGKRKGENRRNGSHKRTSYIGVSKNGPNWQALISINKKKTYIPNSTLSSSLCVWIIFCSLKVSLKKLFIKIINNKSLWEKKILIFTFLLVWYRSIIQSSSYFLEVNFLISLFLGSQWN